MPRILFIAGDPSGDHHAAPIVKRCVDEIPDAHCLGVGGPAMIAAGFKALYPFTEFNRMGFVEVAAQLPFFLRVKKELVALLDSRTIDIVVCVDYPGFNIPLMQQAHARGIPVVWYIVPQVWAWKKKRAAILGECASFIGTVFPFEVELFKKYRAPVAFVGHPLAASLRAKGILPVKPRSQDRINRHREGAIRLALIPGSRRQEVRSMLAPMLEAYSILKKQFPGVTATVSRYAGLSEELFAQIAAYPDVALFSGDLDDLLMRTDLAMVTSGTATLQTALHGVPLVVAYKTSPITYQLLKHFITLPYIGLPNIVAGSKIVPECIQQDVAGDKLAAALAPMCADTSTYAAAISSISGLIDQFGELDPSLEIVASIKQNLPVGAK